jgi:DNA repair exonuclease SbcCD ATPase subunit
MMCGGHGAYRFLESLMDDTFYEHSRYMDHPAHRRDSLAGIEQEVKLMYARGEIDSGTYHRLIDMVQGGQISWNDLDQIGKNSRPAVVQERRTPTKRNAEIVNSLNQLYTHRKQLEDARQETEKVLQTLESEAARLMEQANVAETKAQQAIDNENAARAYLDTRQKALERANAIQTRISDLRQNLSRIENLQADLSTREAELKALESGEQLAELETSIRQGLLTSE